MFDSGFQINNILYIRQINIVSTNNSVVSTNNSAHNIERFRSTM